MTGRQTGSFLPLYRRELGVLFFSPVAYLVMTAFLIISGYYFYTLFTLYSIQSFQAAQTPTLAQNLNLIDGITRPLFLQMGILCLLLLPLLTMRLFAEERKTGTLDLLLTYPVRERHIMMAKFSATATLFLGMIVLTYPLPLMLFYYAHLDAGAVFSGYLGLLLMGSAFIAVGIFLSAVTEHQIVAAVVTLGVLFLSWLLSSSADFLSGAAGRVLPQFSILTHFRNVSKGVIETPDLTFYLLLMSGGLFLAWYTLGTRKWGGWFVTRGGLKSPAAVLGVVISGIFFLQILFTWVPYRVDLTQARQFTLSDATLKVLRGLDQDVDVKAFAKKGSPYHKRLEDLLSLYAYTSPHWKYTLIDPDKNPSMAEKYGAYGFGVLVVMKSGDRESRARLPFEEDVTGALLKVIQKEPKIVCFTTGHGEHGLEAAAKDGYNTVRMELLKSGYTPKITALAEMPGGEDCSLLIVAGARAPWLPGETGAVQKILDQNRPVLFLLEPNGSRDLVRLIEERWGLRVSPGVVVDRTSKVFGGEYEMPVVSRYGRHRITQGFTLNTFYPSSAALELPVPPPVGMVPLVQTGDESWVEEDSAELERGEPVQSAGKEKSGPLILAAAGLSGNIGSGTASRWVVVGDSDFVSNAYFNLAGNGRLFMNLISWLSEDEAMILAGEEKAAAPQPVFLTSSQAKIIFFLTTALFPVILSAIGGFVAYRRRR